MRAVVVTRSVDLAAPPERVWPFVSDTDRFNRLIGAHDVRYVPIEEGHRSSARFLAETRAGGFRLVYEELPFEWSHQRSFGVHRRMRSGPLESYTWRVSLERTRAGGSGGGGSGGGGGARAIARQGESGSGALEGGTRLTVRLELVPRLALLRPIAWLNGRRLTARLVELGALIDAHVIDGAPSPYVKPVSPADAERVAAVVRALGEQGVAAAVAERLGALVREGADADVVRIRPFALADAWGEPRREVLRACLRAVGAGLLELRWGIICPSCLTPSQQVRALDQIGPEGHCQLCDLTFGVELDRAVEATFVPHPAVRRVPETMFCIGGPARTPHVLVQSTVEPRAERALDVPHEPGRYRLFVRGGATAMLEVDEAGEPAARVRLEPGRVEPPRVHVTPGGELRLRSALHDARHVKIERLDFANAAATAHVVSTLEEFRTMFSSELLKPGTPLKVAHAAILFSDLTGSTALYARVGDAAAFRLVDDHFDVLRAVVAAHEGVVVKTMGDAVMAAFADAAACARAGADALARFEAFRASQKHGDLVGLKIGMFAGACYVVTANGALDYFGQTVNCASRLQHLAGSGEIVAPYALVAALPAEDAGRLVLRERFEAAVKGVEGPLDLARLTRAATAAGTEPVRAAGAQRQ